MMADDFLSRWSRRKLKSEPEPEPERNRGREDGPGRGRRESERLAAGGAVVPDDGDSRGPVLDGALTEAPPSDLPDIETLGPGSDFKPFMDGRVPQALRQAALRRLWASNPFYGVRDGLDDYDEDFRALHALAGPVRTSYQVGRGMPDPIKAPDPMAEGDGTRSMETGAPDADGLAAEPAEHAGRGEEAMDQRSQDSEDADPPGVTERTPAEGRIADPGAASADPTGTPPREAGFGRTQAALVSPTELPRLVVPQGEHPLAAIRERRRSRGAAPRSDRSVIPSDPD